MKTISKTAVAVAAGMLFSMGSALAADLGGNCCADLEERVAELEATTARKGNRKVSLTISGLVNRMILSYDDGGVNDATGRSSNTFWGIDNTNVSTRFNLGGNAKIDATRKAGFNMMMEVGSGARSVTVNRTRAEAATGGITAPNVSDLNDQNLVIRDANVWLEDSRIGRLTLGRLTQSGPQGTIDLGGIGVISPGTVLIGTSFVYQGGFGSGATIGNGFDAAADYNKRVDGIRYESPTWQGFQVAATYGEASRIVPNTPATVGDLGNTYAFNLKYANEFNGVRIASAYGYEVIDQDGIALGRNPAKNIRNGVSLSLMHVATGLFVQGGWTRFDSNNGAADKRDGSVWHIAGGVTRNWFGIGNTSLYGEYGKGTDMFWTNRAVGAVVGDDSSFWGLGMVQNIDAAAMELYANYRLHSADLVALPSAEDISLFTVGARIKF